MRAKIALATPILLLGWFATPGAAAAAGTTYRVTVNSVCAAQPAAPDSLPGTLAWALSQANSHPGRDTIEFAVTLAGSGKNVNLDPCWRPNMPFPFGLAATDSVDIIGNGVTIEGNQYFLDPNGEVNNPSICPGAPGGPPTNWISASTGFMQVGTYNVSNTAVAVTVTGMNFHNMNSLFKVEQGASLSVTDSRAWEIDAFLGNCDRPVIETADEGANVTLTRVQVDHSRAPGVRTGEYDIAAVVQGGNGGNLVLDEVYFAANSRGRAVTWLGSAATIVSSRFVQSGGMYLTTDRTEVVNSASYITSTTPADRIYSGRGVLDIKASTFYWAWMNATCPACTMPGMGFLAVNGAVRFTTTAIGASSTFGAGAALLVGTPGAFTSDALTWVQPTADAVGPGAVPALLPNAMINPHGLTPTALPWQPYEATITPLLGTPSAPGVLIDAVPDAQAGGANQLLNPITGAPVTKDVFGNPRNDANDTRDIGAVQLTLAPRLAVVGTTVQAATLGWTRPGDPSTGAITGYGLFYRVKGSASKYTRVNVAGAATLTAQVTGLRPDTSYEFYVVGVNPTGDGPRSNLVVARTLPPAPIPSPEPILTHLDYPAGVGVVNSPLYPIAPHVSPAGSHKFRVSSGKLPAGLRLDPDTGIITGTPTQAGARTVTIQASGANGTATAPLTITVYSTPQPPHLDYPMGRGTVGTPMDPLLSHTAFITGPLTYSVTSGSLPPGLAVDPLTGSISGTPTAPGVFQATITAVGAGGATASGVVRIEVASPNNLLTVSLTAVSHKGKLRLSVLSTCPKQFSFRLQKRATTTSNGGSDEPTATTTWRTLPRTYRTKGASHSLTVNQPKGTYRALVGGACLFSDTQSPQATLKK